MLLALAAGMASAGGNITPSGAVTVNYGSSQTFTITPDAAGGFFSVRDVVVDGAVGRVVEVAGARDAWVARTLQGREGSAYVPAAGARWRIR